MPNKLLTEDLMKPHIARMIQSYIDEAQRYYDSPLAKALRAESEARWKALPWYVKAWRKSWFPEAIWRVKVSVDVLRRGDSSSHLGDY